MPPLPRFSERTLIARGPMFDVWLGDDLRTGGRVAIKASRGGAAARRRLAREARVRRVCDSSGLIPLRYDGSGDAQPRLVLDHVPHCRFDDLTSPQLPRLSRAIILQLLSIMAELHRAGFAHGSIDGGHVLIAAGAEVRLCGLGGAQELTERLEHADALAVGTVLARCVPLSAPGEALPDADRIPPSAIERDPLLVAVIGALLEADAAERIGIAAAFELLAGG